MTTPLNAASMAVGSALTGEVKRRRYVEALRARAEQEAEASDAAGEVLKRGREDAEDARSRDLKRLVGELLVFGRVAEGELCTARCVVATAPAEASAWGWSTCRGAGSRTHWRCR